MNAVRLTILFFVILSGSVLKAQGSLKHQLEYAQNLYNQENYFDAVTELKRLIFFDEKKELVYETNMLTAAAYKAGAMLNDAVYHFTAAVVNARTDEEYYNSRVELARVNILRRTTAQALKLIDDIEETGRFPARQDELNYWRGWAYVFADDFINAAGSFDKTVNGKELSLLCRNADDDKYSEKFAKIISIFIPGAGQVYTGNYFNGIVSLAWNIFAGYLTINSFAEERIFDGLVTGNLLWLRFYSGNIQNAEEFAHQKNLEISNRLLDYLQHEYKGLKP